MARPTVYNRRVHEKLVEAFRTGAPISTACSHAGIAYDTLNRWKRAVEIGAEDEYWRPEFIQLFEDIEKAKEDLHLEALAAIRLAGKKSWPAYAWLLERQYPELYSLKNRVEVSGTGPDGAINVVGYNIVPPAGAEGAKEE